MKKLLVTLLMAGIWHVSMAYDYPYMVFQTADGSTQAIETDGLTISFSNGQLVATNASGSQTFSLAQMSKMYFTADNVTSIQIVEQEALDIDEAAEVYDLQGLKVTRQQMRQGIYILKSKKGTRKIYIK